jgi:hypothetical protein
MRATKRGREEAHTQLYRAIGTVSEGAGLQGSRVGGDREWLTRRV